MTEAHVVNVSFSHRQCQFLESDIGNLYYNLEIIMDRFSVSEETENLSTFSKVIIEVKFLLCHQIFTSFLKFQPSSYHALGCGSVADRAITATIWHSVK